MISLIIFHKKTKLFFIFDSYLKLKEETNKTLKNHDETSQKNKQELDGKISGLRYTIESNNTSLNQKITSVSR